MMITPLDLVEDTTTKSLACLMRNYAGYNFWANTVLVNWLRTKPAAALEQQVPSSFPNIKLTLVHIWQTQVYWLSILKNEARNIHEEADLTLQDAFDKVLIQSAELADYIELMTDKAIEKNTLVVNPWFQCDFANFEYILQVMNHSTYHRGQLVTIGRNLGFTDAPMTDYNFYNVFGK
jgi:uncharacterized damage-inducible protein DinB